MQALVAQTHFQHKLERKVEREPEVEIHWYVLNGTIIQFTFMHASTSKIMKRLIDCFYFEANGTARRIKKVFNELKKIE